MSTFGPVLSGTTVMQSPHRQGERQPRDFTGSSGPASATASASVSASTGMSGPSGSSGRDGHGAAGPSSSGASASASGISGPPTTLEAAFPWLMAQLSKSPTSSTPNPFDIPSNRTTNNDHQFHNNVNPQTQAPPRPQPQPQSSHLDNPDPHSGNSFEDDLSLLFSGQTQHRSPSFSLDPLDNNNSGDPFGSALGAAGPSSSSNNNNNNNSLQYTQDSQSSANYFSESLGGSSSSNTNPGQAGGGDGGGGAHGSGIIPISLPSGDTAGWTMWDLQTGQIPIDQVAPDLAFPHNFISNRQAQHSPSFSSGSWPLSGGPSISNQNGFNPNPNPSNMFQNQQGHGRNSIATQGFITPGSGGPGGRTEPIRRMTEDASSAEPARKRGRSGNRLDGSAASGSGGSFSGPSVGLPGRNAQSAGGHPSNELSPKRRGKAKAEPREIMEIRSRRFRDRAPKTIKERVHRVMAQRMFLLDRVIYKDIEEAQEFSVKGTKGDVARVSIDHEPRCDCADFLKGNAPCEHLIFVFLKVLKIPPESYLWFQKGLLSHELRDIFENTRNPRELPPTLLAFLSQHLGSNSGETPNDAGNQGASDEIDGPLAPLIGTDCQVCFEAFTAEDIRTDRLAYDELAQRMVHPLCLEFKNKLKAAKKEEGSEIKGEVR